MCGSRKTKTNDNFLIEPLWRTKALPQSAFGLFTNLSFLFASFLFFILSRNHMKYFESFGFVFRRTMNKELLNNQIDFFFSFNFKSWHKINKIKINFFCFLYSAFSITFVSNALCFVLFFYVCLSLSTQERVKRFILFFFSPNRHTARYSTVPHNERNMTSGWHERNKTRRKKIYL